MCKPNIFQIATEEFAQDGFITWLLQWADINTAQYNLDLHQVAQDFVRLLLDKSPDFKIAKVEAGRKWAGVIDIWAKVNEDILIIIEDKTGSGQHSNQLSRYKEIAQKWCDANNYQLVCIYLKTGTESNSSLEYVAKNEYGIVDRKILLNLFNKYQIQNEIYTDFVDRLKSIESSEQSFRTLQIKDWNWNSWIGLYQFLDNELKITDWGYVANPTGGFLGIWWHPLYWEECQVYLQIEQNSLCFKIHVEDEDKSEKRNEWFLIIKNNAVSEGKTEIHKPERFGTGTWMTVAVVQRKDWLGADEDFFDEKKVIDNLKEYEQFLNRCIE